MFKSSGCLVYCGSQTCLCTTGLITKKTNRFGSQYGKKLEIVPSEIVLFGEWRKLHGDTLVLSKDTGAKRSYGADPYGDYYTSESVSFGANFKNTRLHPKTIVIGIEVNGKQKAYKAEALKIGETQDVFSGKKITIKKDAIGQILITSEGVPLPHVSGFWFSWLAVHPNTELFQ